MYLYNLYYTVSYYTEYKDATATMCLVIHVLVSPQFDENVYFIVMLLKRPSLISYDQLVCID